MFWFFGHKARGILAARPRVEAAPPASEGEVLTAGPPGKSCRSFISGENLHRQDCVLHETPYRCPSKWPPDPIAFSFAFFLAGPAAYFVGWHLVNIQLSSSVLHNGLSIFWCLLLESVLSTLTKRWLPRSMIPSTIVSWDFPINQLKLAYCSEKQFLKER